ncbi:MAG: TldD/PmbA family protein [Candidatus Hydrothermarchaeota archaeon]|nr:TldD/PmbA family protein [Candidatus Hydrothermarchaeota archaeon]
MDIDKLKKIFDIPARFIDISVQRMETNSIILKDGIAREVSSGEIFGVGARVLDRTWGFASSNSLEDIYALAEKAYRIARNGEKIEFAEGVAVEDVVKTVPKIDPFNAGVEEKKEILHQAEKVAQSYKEVVSSSFAYSDSRINSSYLNSEGSSIEAEYTRVALFSSVFAKKNGNVQVGFERLGSVAGLEALHGAADAAKAASERAIRLLDAGEAPSGNFGVILDPKLSGVFIHEALGHAVEADHVIQGESILEGRLGQQIGSELVTVYDDAALENSFGFYFYDSEGTKGKKKTLLENGALKTYLHSRETSTKLKQENTGNARSQAFNCQPIVRMSNTYLEPKDFEFEEMLEDIRYGVYLRGSKGGEVDTVRGVFQFSAEEGFLIENGEITKPIKDVALSGKTLEILKNIDAVGSDFGLHIGFCGKASQLVPVSDGGATIRTFATVGGAG